MTTIPLPRGFNLNTATQIIGFVTVLVAVVWSYANLTYKQENLAEFIVEQKEFNTRVDERFRAGGEKLQQIPVLVADLARLETANSGQDDRMGRMSESSGNAISDIRSGLSDIKTDVALVKQSLARIELFQSSSQASPRAAAR